MSALKVLKKLSSGNKKRIKNPVIIPMERSSSHQKIVNGDSNSQNDQTFDSQFRRRARTYTGGVTKPNLKQQSSAPSIIAPSHSSDGDICQQILEDMQMTLTSPRHYLRRRALVESELQDDVNSSVLKSVNQTSVESKESNETLSLSVNVEGHKITDSVKTMPSHSLYDMIEYLLMKHDIDLKHELSEYLITASRSNDTVSVDLDGSSVNYRSCLIEIKAASDQDDTDLKSEKEVTNYCEKEEKEFHTVKDCLDYFDRHGLNELPLPTHNEEDSHHLPRVTPLEPIVNDWEQLPIDSQALNALTDEEIKQQRTIWELIHTEYSHLQTLETIINVFMRCLELIQRANLLSEENYHNIFGYMEDLYHAHEQLWTYTFEPCINKTYDNGLPLDLNDIIDRFPQSFGTHFEIYEQHCALDSLNIKALNKAMNNPDFNDYIKWCEARPECNRLQLKQLLVAPMQRLTRYSLLINVIAKKTASSSQKKSLEKIVDEINAFLRTVNNAIRIQEETERVKDAMNRITSYSVVDVPHELRDFAHPYTHLDLLAPMLDVEVDKPRLLMVEGSLHFRDNIKQKTSPVYVFLFTDMLLITKPHRKVSNQFTVVRPPFKVTTLNLHCLDPESICCLVLSEYNLITSWFILKANNPMIAKEWLNQITAAQQFYQDAMDKKAHTWKLMESLRSERILNGVENLDSLSASLSQSLWSIHSLTNNGRLASKYSSNDSVLLKRGSCSSLGDHRGVTRTTSADTNCDLAMLNKLRSSYRSMSGSADFTNIPSFHSANESFDRTSSLSGLAERPHSFCDTSNMSTISESNLLTDERHASLPTPTSSLDEDKVYEYFSDSNLRSICRLNDETSSKVRRNGIIAAPPLQWMQKSPVSNDNGIGSNDTDSFFKRADGSIEDDTSLTKPTPGEVKSCMKTCRKKLNDPYEPATSSLVESSKQVEDSSKVKPFHWSLPEQNYSLKSILRRTPSPRFPKETSPPTLTRKKSYSAAIDQNPTSSALIRPKCHSVGSIDAPHYKNMFHQHVHTVSTQHTDCSQYPCSSPPVSSPSRLPHNEDQSVKLASSGLLNSRSQSESSILSAVDNSSYFNITYIKEGSQIPNVATVKEEDEVKNNDELIQEDVQELSISSDSMSEDLENASLKTTRKPKVLFSDMTEICSFDESDEELRSTPETYDIIPSWKPSKSIVKDEKTEANKDIGAKSNVETSKTAVDLADLLDLHVANGMITPTEPSIPETKIKVVVELADASETSHTREMADTVKKNSSLPEVIIHKTKESATTKPAVKAAQSNRKNLHDVATKIPDSPKKSPKKNFKTLPKLRRENKTRHSAIKRSGKSVQELSKLFESPRGSQSDLSPSLHKGLTSTPKSITSAKGNQLAYPTSKSTKKVPTNKQVSSHTTPTKSASPQKSPARMGIKKRKESVSRIPVPNETQHIFERRKSHVTVAKRLGNETVNRSEKFSSQESLDTALLLDSIHISSHSPVTDTKMNEKPENKPRIRNGSSGPVTRPKPIRKKEVVTHANSCLKQNESTFTPKESMMAKTAPKSITEVFRNNSNSNNNNFCETVSVLDSGGIATKSAPPVDIDSICFSFKDEDIDSGNSSSEQKPIINTIFRPRRKFDDSEFEKCSLISPLLGFNCKLKHHHTFSSSPSPIKSPREALFNFRMKHEWQNYGSSNKEQSEISSSHKWKQIR